MNSHEGATCFEQGPIRPPSEAGSLLVRVTRNCPWNRCAFCRTYQGERFSLRDVSLVREEIQLMARMAEKVRGLAEGSDKGGVPADWDWGCFRTVAAWLRGGGESVFLQDADSLSLKTDRLAEVIALIRTTFPSVRRITTYARAKTAARRTVDELRRLREAGLSRIHMGMESGHDPLLAFIDKGVTAAEQIDAGQKIREAGISLCEYVMPGLGGSRWSAEHAVQSAHVLNRVNPDHIRLRTLQVVPGTALAAKVREGEFHPLDDESILREIRLMISSLQGIGSEIVSDHILNLLEDLHGKLPEDREKLLGLIDRFFALPDEDRQVFRLGRRMGAYRHLEDLDDIPTRRHIEGILEGYQGDPLRLESDLATLRGRYI
jgi:hypothetical protein